MGWRDRFNRAYDAVTNPGATVREVANNVAVAADTVQTAFAEKADAAVAVVTQKADVAGAVVTAKVEEVRTTVAETGAAVKAEVKSDLQFGDAVAREVAKKETLDEARERIDRAVEPVSDVPVLGGIAKSGAGAAKLGANTVHTAGAMGVESADAINGKNSATVSGVVVHAADGVSNHMTTVVNDVAGNAPVVGNAARVPFNATLGTMEGMGAYDSGAANAYKPSEEDEATYGFNRDKMRAADALAHGDTGGALNAGESGLGNAPGAAVDVGKLALDFAGGGGAAASTGGNATARVLTDGATDQGADVLKQLAREMQKDQPQPDRVIANHVPSAVPLPTAEEAADTARQVNAEGKKALDTLQKAVEQSIPLDILKQALGAVSVKLACADSSVSEATTSASTLVASVARTTRGPGRA